MCTLVGGQKVFGRIFFMKSTRVNNGSVTLKSPWQLVQQCRCGFHSKFNLDYKSREWSCTIGRLVLQALSQQYENKQLSLHSCLLVQLFLCWSDLSCIHSALLTFSFVVPKNVPAASLHPGPTQISDLPSVHTNPMCPGGLKSFFVCLEIDFEISIAHFLMKTWYISLLLYSVLNNLSKQACSSNMKARLLCRQWRIKDSHFEICTPILWTLLTKHHWISLETNSYFNITL